MVLAQLGGVDDARVMVYRQDKGSPMTYVATYQPEDVQGEASLFETIRQEFGGGSYRVHVRNASGLLANRRIDIADRKVPTDGGLAASVTASIAALMTEQRRQFETLVATLTMQRPPVAEITEDALLSRFKLMAEIVRPQGNGGGDARTFMQALQQGIELGKSMQQAPTGAGTEDVLLQALSTFAPVIADAASQRRAVVAPPQRPRIAAPGGAVPGPTATNQPPPSATVNPATDPAADLRQLLALLLRAAVNDSEPDIYAEMVCDQLGDDSVMQLLAQADPLALLTGFAPEVSTHAAWFARLLASIKELYSDEPEPPTVAADGPALGPRGGAEDPADHAHAG
jgi:hypothetical protein